MKFNHLLAICAGSASLGFIAGYLTKMFREVSLPDVELSVEEEDTNEGLFEGMTFDRKIVIGVRTDMKLTDPEVYSLSADAVVKVVLKSLENIPENVDMWLQSGQTKVCTKVKSPELMDDLIQKAEDAGMIYEAVEYKDKIAVCAVGPETVDKVNVVTGHLGLL